MPELALARERDVADHRRHLVRLTAKGHRRLAAAAQAQRDAEDELFAGLDDAQPPAPASGVGCLPGACWVCKYIPSCCSGVFVDQSAEFVASLELVWRVGNGEADARPCYRWCEPEGAMWPMGVVVVDVGAQDTLELPAAGDQEPVEAVAADGADPAFRECVCLWRSKWGSRRGGCPASGRAIPARRSVRAVRESLPGVPRLPPGVRGGGGQ